MLSLVSGVSRIMRRRAARLLADTRGQDLVEYALLTGIIAVVSALIGQPFIDRMKNAYETRTANVKAISAPPAPLP